MLFYKSGLAHLPSMKVMSIDVVFFSLIHRGEACGRQPCSGRTHPSEISPEPYMDPWAVRLSGSCTLGGVVTYQAGGLAGLCEIRVWNSIPVSFECAELSVDLRC